MKRSVKFRKEIKAIYFLTLVILMSFCRIGPVISQNSSFNLLEIADSLMKSDQPEEAIKIYNSLLENQEEADKYKLKYAIGYALVIAGKEKDALPYLNAAYKEAKSKGDSVTIAKCFDGLGRVKEYTGEPDSAFYYYKEALSIWEVKKGVNQRAGSYQSMAQILRVMGRLDEAKTYINKALKLIISADDPKVIANIYNETAYLFELNQKLDSAKFYYNRLIQVSKTYNNLKGISAGYSNLASLLTTEKKFPEALKYFKLGLEIDLQLNYQYYIACSYRGIADCYYNMGDLYKAIEYIEMAEKNCDPSWLNENLINEEKKFKYYKALGNYKDALIAHEKFKFMKDSLLDVENQKNITEILAKYETEKKKNQIEILDKTNNLNIQKIKNRNLLLAILSLLFILLILFALNVVQLKNRRINQMEIELHNFVSKFNSDPEKNQPNESEEYLEKYKNLGLTQRESEILNLIQIGLSNREIGEKLFVSENTIKFHLKNIYIKLDVKNRIQAASKAV